MPGNMSMRTVRAALLALGLALAMAPAQALTPGETDTFQDGTAALDAPPAENVPEPDTLALLGGAIAAFALFALIRRKRRDK